MDIFEGGQAVSLAEILGNRDWRVQMQNRLMSEFPDSTIVSVKLNVPGWVKNSPVLTDVFEAGWAEILLGETTSISVSEQSRNGYPMTALSVKKFADRPTGPEGFLVFDSDLTATKTAMIEFEEGHALGRLFDLDVMNLREAGKQLSRTSLGFPLRKCFVCGRPAKECARDGRHTADEIIASMNRIVENAE